MSNISDALDKVDNTLMEIDQALKASKKEPKAFDPQEECGLPPDAVAALTMWGEARGEGNRGIQAVASVILRRAERRMAEKDEPLDLAVSKVCLASAQFSCWKDGTFVQEAPYECPEWSECDRVAKLLVSGSFEPTVVATAYHPIDLIPAPSWAGKTEFVDKIGRHLFYKEW